MPANCAAAAPLSGDFCVKIDVFYAFRQFFYICSNCTLQKSFFRIFCSKYLYNSKNYCIFAAKYVYIYINAKDSSIESCKKNMAEEKKNNMPKKADIVKVVSSAEVSHKFLISTKTNKTLLK